MSDSFASLCKGWYRGKCSLQAQILRTGCTPWWGSLCFFWDCFWWFWMKDVWRADQGFWRLLTQAWHWLLWADIHPSWPVGSSLFVMAHCCNGSVEATIIHTDPFLTMTWYLECGFVFPKISIVFWQFYWFTSFVGHLSVHIALYEFSETWWCLGSRGRRDLILPFLFMEYKI